MARRYRSRSRYSSSASRDAALRHVEEARQFSQEMGGSDRDVKDYFFALQHSELNNILREYGRKYGQAAESYARDAMSRWRTGQTKMSGMVAKRLFSLLPPRMPLNKKFELAANIWAHFGPSSSHDFTINSTADVALVSATLAKKLDEVVTEYTIPSNVKMRFEWLSGGDITMKEKLLNHFRSLEKRLLLERVQAEIPILQRQMNAHAQTTGRARTVLQVHKHTISIWVDNNAAATIQEGKPATPAMQLSSSSGVLWFFAVLAALILVAMFK